MLNVKRASRIRHGQARGAGCREPAETLLPLTRPSGGRLIWLRHWSLDRGWPAQLAGSGLPSNAAASWAGSNSRSECLDVAVEIDDAAVVSRSGLDVAEHKALALESLILAASGTSEAQGHQAACTSLVAAGDALLASPDGSSFAHLAVGLESRWHLGAQACDQNIEDKRVQGLESTWATAGCLASA